MGNLRKLERNVIKNKATKENKDFETAWDEYREHKYVIKDSEGTVLTDKTPRSNQKKKHKFFDDKRQYFNMFAWAASMRKQKETENAENKEN